MAVPVAPVVTAEGEKLPPPGGVMRSVTGMFGATVPSALVAVTVTVAVLPGAPLPGSIRTVSVPSVCAAAVTLTVTGYRVVLT